MTGQRVLGVADAQEPPEAPEEGQRYWGLSVVDGSLVLLDGDGS